MSPATDPPHDPVATPANRVLHLAENAPALDGLLLVFVLLALAPAGRDAA